MRIPVVMPVAHVQVDADGALRIEVDNTPYDARRPLDRGDLQQVLEQIAAELQSPIRVDVVEADGTSYTDITTPTEPEVARSMPQGRCATGLEASGFRPGEQVAVVFILAHQAAGADGSAVLQLPPALLAVRRRSLALVGLSSGTVAPLGETP